MTNNDALLTRARRLDPVPDEAFANFARSAEAQETLNAILQTSALPTVEPSTRRPRTARRPDPVVRTMVKRTIAIAAVAAVVLGVVILDRSDRPHPEGNSAWSPELVSLAEASPRFLIEQEGWKVARVDEFRSDSGEMVFQNGPNATNVGAGPGVYWMELSWTAAAEHEAKVQDWRDGASESREISIAGHDANLFRAKVAPPNMPHTLTALWLVGEHSMQLRSDAIPTITEFRDVAATIRSVGVDTWLSAMPAGVVTPNERNDAVERILARLPVPTNLDVEALNETEMVTNDYSLDYDVMNAVVCGWVQQWINGRNDGDERATREAVRAMNWGGWAKRDNHGQWSSFLADVALAMKTNVPVNGDRSLPVGIGYQRHLGCAEG